MDYMDKAQPQDIPLLTNAAKTAGSFAPRAVRNWLRSPTLSARWLWDGARYSFGITSVVEIRPGWRLTCHPAAYRCAYFAQKNDPEQIAEFDGFDKLSPGAILFDLGAHFGLFSLAALPYGGPTSLAFAVDPSPVAVSFLNIQAGLNHYENRLQVVQAAVSDRAGRQGMVAVGVLASGYYVAPTPEHPTSEQMETRSVTLDSLVDELGVEPTHLKIDVEGYEAAVLRGGQKLLSQTAAPIIFIEIHNQIVRDLGGDAAATLKLLRDYGYHTFTSDRAPVIHDKLLSESLVRLIARKDN
jgi:FkbM family methyltransferase